jgi:CRISPR-associated endonuclease Csn1
MPVCKGLIDVFGDSIANNLNDLSRKIINEKYSIEDLWHVLFAFDERTATEKDFRKKFAKEKLCLEIVKDKKGKDINYPEKFAKLKSNITTGYADLSTKAICKIIPFLKEGYLY